MIENRLYLSHAQWRPAAVHHHRRHYGIGHTQGAQSAVPITVSEQIESTHAAFEAGAALVHVHVRNDDQSPTSNPDKFAEFQNGSASAAQASSCSSRRAAGRVSAPSAEGCCIIGPTWRRSRRGRATSARVSRTLDSGTGGEDASIRHQAGDRGVRSRDALQRRRVTRVTVCWRRRCTCSSCSA